MPYAVPTMKRWRRWGEGEGGAGGLRQGGIRRDTSARHLALQLTLWYLISVTACGHPLIKVLSCVVETLTQGGGPYFSPPTHNREPYDTRLSDTMVAHPSASS